MKKYNFLMAGTIVAYLCLAVFVLKIQGFSSATKGEDLVYKVEIHQIMQEFKSAGYFYEPDLSSCEYLRKVTFLPVHEIADEDKIDTFFQNQNRVNSSVQPLITGNGIQGYVRFDYVTNFKDNSILWWIEGILFVAFVWIFAILLFVRVRILKPFHTISELPYELSRGHLKGELEESKSRFFGKFIWGISMLRDTLNDSKTKELNLLREKKLLLLSISHDIKIPLSTIQLYAKAIKEDVYDTEEEKTYAAGQIEVHAKEIEGFVKEIMSASSEDLIHIEVNHSEFYLKDLIEKIREIYEPKARIILTSFHIGKYENCLLKGDFDRAVEVLENLLENAFKYGDGKEIRIECYEEDYCQVIQVFNTGEPVADAEMQHLFDSFYRGSNTNGKQGNGLGLYIGRKIMNQMDGEVFAEKRENGMSFCVVFPM